MAQRGYQVSLHEKRGDMRLEEIDAGRSINLALSSRGLMALDRVGLKEIILKECIPMHGRLIHPLGGTPFLSPYSGRKEDYINSVSRGGLNITLLNLAEAQSNIQLHFNSKCTNVDLATAKVTFKDHTTGKTWEEEGEVVIGTDGAGSVVRMEYDGENYITVVLLFSKFSAARLQGIEHPACRWWWI